MNESGGGRGGLWDSWGGYEPIQGDPTLFRAPDGQLVRLSEADQQNKGWSPRSGVSQKRVRGAPLAPPTRLDPRAVAEQLIEINQKLDMINAGILALLEKVSTEVVHLQRKPPPPDL
jgi:hypothetical protein